MMDFNFKVIGLVAGVLFKPLALATEPFFRKNLGERYLTRSIVMLALGLWLAASGLSGLFASHAAPRTH